MFSISLVGFSQNYKKVVESKKLIWCGLDFSLAKMIGSTGFRYPDNICYRYIHVKWNGVIFEEKTKYNVGRYLGNKQVEYHLELIQNRNAAVTPDSLITDFTYSISKEEIISAIEEYPTFETDGIGLVFMVESFSKIEDLAHIWVTFFDCETKEVYLTQRISGESGGMGIVSYWANAVNNVMKNCRKEYYFWVKKSRL